jgi:hypothetical protein
MSNKPPNDRTRSESVGKNPGYQQQVPSTVSVVELNQLNLAINKLLSSQEQLDARDKRRFRLEVLGLGLVVLTAILAGINIFLLRRGMKTSQQAADAASGSLNITREQVHVGQRAYLIVEKFQVDLLKVGEPIRIHFDMRNTGQTPALDISLSAFSDVLTDLPNPVPYNFSDPHRSDLGAGQSSAINIGRVNPLRTDELAAILTEEFSFVQPNMVMVMRKPNLVAYGKLIYSDVFGGHDETEFCAALLPKSFRGQGERDFGHCLTNNHIR